MRISKLLEPLHKPLYRVYYPINLATYGLGSYGLSQGEEMMIGPLALATISLLGIFLSEIDNRKKRHTETPYQNGFV